MTPPYVIVGFNQSGVSATLPVANDQTGEYVGQAIVDFSLDRVFDALENTRLAEDGFPLLITAERDVSTANILSAPGVDFASSGLEFESVEDLLLNDDKCNGDEQSDSCKRRRHFEAIVRDMEDGASNSTSFHRAKDGELEKVFIAYAPVSIPSFRAIDPSDIRRGLHENVSVVYSLALAETEEGLYKTFRAQRRTIADIVYISLGIFLGIIGLTYTVVVYLSSKVSRSITYPTSKLLVLVIAVNR